MEIFAHRGQWTSPQEHNSVAALNRAWQHGFGVETDLRDLDGSVVVSHDPPSTAEGAPSTLTELLTQWDAAGRAGRLALNVKADGLAKSVSEELRRFAATRQAFVFDMSVPDQGAYLLTDVPVYTRWSEFEPLVIRGGTTGIWLDAFDQDDWWDPGLVRDQLDRGREIVLVSPELHGRDAESTWDRLRRNDLHASPALGLCTDLPHEAEEFFA